MEFDECDKLDSCFIMDASRLNYKKLVIDGLDVWIHFLKFFLKIRVHVTGNTINFIDISRSQLG